MATIESTTAHQGLGSYDVSLDAGEAVIVHLTKAIPWERGGFGWQVFPTTGGEVRVFHSLASSGDVWTEDESSPFDSAYGDSEPGRIERMRFLAEKTGAKVVLLGPGDVNVIVESP